MAGNHTSGLYESAADGATPHGLSGLTVMLTLSVADAAAALTVNAKVITLAAVTKGVLNIGLAVRTLDMSTDGPSICFQL